MTTIHIPVNNNPYETIRLDTYDGKTLVTVYNVNINDIDRLIEKLQQIKADNKPAPVVSNIISDEPEIMTAVLGPKPDPTGWYRNALEKAAAQLAKQQPAPMPVKEADPEMPKPRKGIHTLNVIGVETKPRTRFGKTYPGKKYDNFNADIIKGESIRIYGISPGLTRYDKESQKHIHYKVAFDKTFKVGDSAEYDSYNFAYTGKIVAIGEKTVTIEKDSYRGKTARLDLQDFINRNWDYDPVKIAEQRASWSD